MVAQSTSSTAPAARQRADLLSRRQLLIVIGIGIAYWLVAALFVQFTSPLGFFGPTASAILFVVSVPFGWLSVRLIRWAAQLSASQVLPGLALGTAAAAFLDGLALTWQRSLYSNDAAQALFGAAWILWGVGVLLTAAAIDSYRD